MPLGLALLSLIHEESQTHLKGFLDSSYPREFNISRGLIRKIVEVVQDSVTTEDGVYELKYANKLILVHSKYLEDSKSYELIVVILTENEVQQVKEFYELLSTNVEKFYEYSNKDRTLNFSKFAELFFHQNSSKKLLIIGFPSAGKTCIKKAFFDGINPEELLGLKAPEPTRGLAHYVYSWLDAEVGIVDSSGQEFHTYVEPNNSFERMIAFEESDIIIYVFDIQNWIDQQAEVLENLEKIITTKNSITSNAKIYAFCHKIDLLEGSNQEKANNFLKIKTDLERQFHIKVIFTSIQPELIHTLFRSMQIILNDMSQMGTSIEDFCEDVIRNQNKSAIFLLNDKNTVISQKSTPDLDLDDVSNIIHIVKNQKELLEQSSEFGALDYSVIHTVNDMALIVKSINILKYGVSTVAYLSKQVSKRTLNELIEKLDKRMNFESRQSEIRRDTINLQ